METLFELPPPLAGALPIVLLGAVLLFVCRWRNALVWSIALIAYSATVLLWIAVLAPALNGTEPASDAKAIAMLIGAAAAGLLFPTVLGVSELAKAVARKRLQRARGFPVISVGRSD